MQAQQLESARAELFAMTATLAALGSRVGDESSGALAAQLTAAQGALELERARVAALAAEAESGATASDLRARAAVERGEAARQQRGVDIAAARSALAAKDAESAALTVRVGALTTQLAAATQATRAMAEGKTLAFAKLKEVVARLRAVQVSLFCLP